MTHRTRATRPKRRMPTKRGPSLEILEQRELLASMIYDLGTLGGSTSQANAINDLGQVVGTSQTATGSEDAFIWNNSVQGIQPLAVPSSFLESTATGINNSGQVAVTVYTNTPGDGNAYLDSSGMWTNLGTFQGGTTAGANAINNSGQVVGEAAVGAVAQAFLYSGGSLMGLGTLPGSISVATGINNNGQVVGDSGTSAFSGGTMNTLKSFLATVARTTALGINDSGEIVGQTVGLGPSGGIQNVLQEDAFLYSDGGMTNLGPGVADGINNMGQVVGTNGSYPVLWENGDPIALGTFLPPNSGWTLSTATAINNEGQVVGVGTINGQTHAYLLDIDQTSQAFTVSNLNDSGPGSLRDAIDQANDFVSSIGRALITFSTSIDFGTISLQSPLPAITRDDVTIDGPLTLDAVSGDGLDLDAPGDIVQGLTITGFSGSGIVVNGGDALITGNTITGNGEYGIDVESSGNTIGAASTQGIGPSFGGNLLSGNGYSGILVFSSAGNVIEGNLIGTDATGTVAQGNTDGGVYLWNAAGNTIGGTSPAARNIISGNASAAYAGVNVYESLGNVVEGNYIGTDISGSVALGNLNGVDISNGSAANTIGGATSGSGNMISGNAGYGVFITGVSENLVAGNLIGTDATGKLALGNASGGVYITGSGGNTVGGTAATARNVIAASSAAPAADNDGLGDAGVLISGSTSNVVAGNYIGTDVTGSVALGNWVGVEIDSGSGTVGGANIVAGNLISGNNSTGLVMGSNDDLAQGNLIGTDATGEKGLGNALDGIDAGGQSNTIGGTSAGAGNIVSANQGYGIELSATDDLVAGNFIGTDATGESALGNADGILDYGVSNTLGGTVAGARNIISGNLNYGIELDATDELVEGNYIGTDGTGETAVMNGSIIITDVNNSVSVIENDGTGVFIGFASTDCTVGGTTAGARNLISGNMIAGVVMEEDSSDLIEGNYIGTDVTGTVALGNGSFSFPNFNEYVNDPRELDFAHVAGGVVVCSGVTSDTIGGTTAGAGNLISGNAGDGVNISDGGTFFSELTSQIVVEGNLIGTDANGTAPLPNTGSGVDIVDGSQSNTIGGTTSGAGNIIAFNMLNGVTVGNSSFFDPTPDMTAGNSILENSIFSNGVPSADQGPFDMQGIGIDLGGNGVTQNGSMGDVGPNLYQVFPDLGSVFTSDGVTTITGSLYANPNTTYRIEFFSNPTADPSGYGQGKTFLMATYVTTDFSGEADFDLDTPSGLPIGQFITATATDPAGNTSEFSADVENFGLDITGIAAISPNPRNTPVSAVDVTLDEYVGQSFTIGALSLTDNGGPNLITSAVTISIVSGADSTYQIGGIAGLTTAEGTYSLTVDATQIDSFGDFGNGSVSTSWLMDTTPPTSTVNALPSTTTATTFTVSATGSDPTGSNGSTPSGIASFAIYTSTDNSAFTLWTTVTPSSPSAIFTGQADHTYGFYSVATDNAGNVQATPVTAQATVEILPGYIVNDSGDAPLDTAIGPGETATGTITLRSAIEQVNIDGGGSITFAKAMTISIGSQLEPITANGVTINGGTVGSVILQGGPGYSGLVIQGGGATIENLVVDDFQVLGINTQIAGIYLESANNVIESDYIGTDASGSLAAGNYNGILDVTGNNTIEKDVISGNTNTGILLNGGSGDQVHGNLIGTDASGLKRVGNPVGVAIQGGSASNTIDGNVISGNNTYGIDIDGTGTSQNVVVSNWIGIEANGATALSNGIGITISGGSTANTIGATIAGVGNVISGNATVGVEISDQGTSQNLVAGNFIGTDTSGLKRLGNQVGVAIQSGSASNTIGGANAGAANVISGNSGTGIQISGASSNLVEGNFIGTGVGGETAVGNQVGVAISNGSVSNSIGGAINVISGNSKDGVDIDGTGTSQNVVVSAWIGIDRKGTTALPNGIGVAVFGGATANTIGATISGVGNVISGNASVGVEISDQGTSQNLVAGNFIGTDTSGLKRLGNQVGVAIQSGSASNTIEGNVISGNTTYGIDIDGKGTSQNVVASSWIGIEANGTTALSNGIGIAVFGGSTANTIGATIAGTGNVISGNATVGIEISDQGTSQNLVAGNYIGTDTGGETARGNQIGVAIQSGSASNTIGGTITGARNVISGNSMDGIDIDGTGTSQNVVSGNFIGTGVNGTTASTNQTGIALTGGSTANTIGGSASAARNIISGDAFAGVWIDGQGTDSNVVAGNWIGVTVSGDTALPDGKSSEYEYFGTISGGVVIDSGASGNRIGTDGTSEDSGEGNVISGNADDGIDIWGNGTSGNLVAGNEIGTNAAGTISLGNLGEGVFLVGGATGNTIGGTAAGARNVISGNGDHGVVIGEASSNLVEGNYIGTDVKGSNPLGNPIGVFISSNSMSNTIGGAVAGAGNVIAFNAGAGVIVGSSSTDQDSGNAILGNSIFSNTDLGIDLGDNGVTTNGASGHTGPNLFQDFPVLTSVVTTDGITTIIGTLSASASTTYRVEFFSNPAADPSGYGQGESYLTFANVTTNSSGTVNFSVPTPSPVPVGQFISATATDPAGNTSEFSADIVVSSPSLVPTSITAVSPNPRNTAVSSVDVTFSEPVNLSSFTTSTLTLTDDGGTNLITSAVSISLVSGATYQIGGLNGLTSAEGAYTLTVNAADIDDQSGNPGSGSLSTSWLMDTTPPTSTVNALPAQTTSTSFTVSATSSDPTGSNGSTPSGVASIALYDSKDGGSYTQFASVTPASPSALFTGQAGSHLRLLQHRNRQRRQRPGHAHRPPANRADHLSCIRDFDCRGHAEPSKHASLDHRCHV